MGRNGAGQELLCKTHWHQPALPGGGFCLGSANLAVLREVTLILWSAPALKKMYWDANAAGCHHVLRNRNTENIIDSPDLQP